MEFTKAGHHALAQSITSQPRRLGAGFVVAFAAVLACLTFGLWRAHQAAVQFKKDLDAGSGQYQAPRLRR